MLAIPAASVFTFTGRCRFGRRGRSPCHGCSQARRHWESVHCCLPSLRGCQQFLFLFCTDGVARTVPGNHLLGTTNTLGLVVLAVDGGLGGSELAVGRSVGNVALVVGHVHVRLAAAIGNPEPGAVATAGRAGGKVSGDVVGSQALPGGVLENREDNEVLHVDLADIGLVGNGPGSSGSS